jgi:DNA-3-methyladenine glycosylase II
MNRQSQPRELRSASAAEEAAGPPIYAPEGLAEGISILVAEPVFAEILERAGPPRFRRRRNGFGTLLHIIIEQQVSIDAAAAMHRRLVGLCNPLTPKV